MSLVKLKLRIIEDLDRISNLPEHIIHYILSFLPIKDAGRTCILSKTWKSLCSSYNIVSYLHLDHNSFALQLLVSAESGQQEPEIYEIRDRFMDYADSHLLKVIRDQSPVLKLAFDVAVIDSEFARVDQFMEILGRAKVEELSVFVQTQDFRWYENMFVGNEYYEFPYSIMLTSKWLQSLTVKGCKFSSQVNSNTAGMFSSLRQLCLSQVLLPSEEALCNLASCCPAIEIIEFDCCTFVVGTLKLSKFPKLKQASVLDHQFDLWSVDITETNLESFHCNTDEMECLISSAACSNIRELTLSNCSVTGHNLLEVLPTSFPLLEKAELYNLTEFHGLDRIKIANSHMRILKLLYNGASRVISVECPNLRHFNHIGPCKELYLDCPKLQTYYYSGTNFPRLMLLDLPTDMEYIFFSFYYGSYVLHTSWFVDLRKFVEQMGGRTDVYVHLSVSPNMVVEFVLEEFIQAVQTFQPSNVHLEVDILPSQGKKIPAAFLDGLIWSTYPATLSVGGGCYDFVKDLCEKVAEKSRDKSCCDQQLCNKYWWHNISDFEVEHREEDMKHDLVTLVKMCEQSRRVLSGHHIDRLPISFEFEWYSIERFTAELLVEMAYSESNLNP